MPVEEEEEEEEEKEEEEEASTNKKYLQPCRANLSPKVVVMRVVTCV